MTFKPNAGQSTYFIRHAKKDMEVIAIDPEENLQFVVKRDVELINQVKLNITQAIRSKI